MNVPRMHIRKKRKHIHVRLHNKIKKEFFGPLGFILHRGPKESSTADFPEPTRGLMFYY